MLNSTGGENNVRLKIEHLVGGALVKWIDVLYEVDIDELIVWCGGGRHRRQVDFDGKIGERKDH